jgi:hypothetical protein
MEKIYQPRYQEIPTKFRESLQKANASEEEINSLFSRILYIDELGQKLVEWGNFDDELTSEESFLDRIELHAGLCLSIGREGSYSWWIAHSSWASDVGISSDHPIEETIKKFSACVSRKSNFRELSFNLGTDVCSLVDIFFASKNPKHAMYALIALNIMVAEIISVFIRQRILLQIEA